MFSILVVVSLAVPLIYLIITIYVLNSKYEKGESGNSLEIKVFHFLILSLLEHQLISIFGVYFNHY